MPDPGNAISGLYPQPPNLGQNNSVLGGNPLVAAGQIMNLQAMQGQRATGAALLSGLNPDGSFNPGAAVSAAQSNPNAAWGGAQFSRDVLANRQADLQNGIAGAQLESTRNMALAGYLSGWAGKTPSPDDVQTIRANAVKFGGNPAVWGAINTPKQAKQAIDNARLAAAGAGAGLSPTATAPTSGLAPTVAPLAEATRAGAETGGQRVVGGTPQQQTDIDEYTKDQAQSAATVANLRPLQQALPLIQQLGNTQFGPTSPEFTKAKATLASLGIIDPNTSDGSVRQEVGKYLLRYASQANAAGRSDQALSAALGSNPNADTMMKPAVLNLVRNQIGMDRMDAARPLAVGGAQGYLSQGVKAKYNTAVDPRAFSFDLMSPAERADLQKSLGPKTSPAYTKFVNSYTIAKQTGMLGAPPAPSGRQ